MGKVVRASVTAVNHQNVHHLCTNCVHCARLLDMHHLCTSQCVCTLFVCPTLYCALVHLYVCAHLIMYVHHSNHQWKVFTHVHYSLLRCAYQISLNQLYTPKCLKACPLLLGPKNLFMDRIRDSRLPLASSFGSLPQK